MWRSAGALDADVALGGVLGHVELAAIRRAFAGVARYDGGTTLMKAA